MIQQKVIQMQTPHQNFRQIKVSFNASITKPFQLPTQDDFYFYQPTQGFTNKLHLKSKNQNKNIQKHDSQQQILQAQHDDDLMVVDEMEYKNNHQIKIYANDQIIQEICSTNQKPQNMAKTVKKDQLSREKHQIIDLSYQQKYEYQANGLVKVYFQQMCSQESSQSQYYPPSDQSFQNHYLYNSIKRRLRIRDLKQISLEQFYGVKKQYQKQQARQQKIQSKIPTVKSQKQQNPQDNKKHSFRKIKRIQKGQNKRQQTKMNKFSTKFESKLKKKNKLLYKIKQNRIMNKNKLRDIFQKKQNQNNSSKLKINIQQDYLNNEDNGRHQYQNGNTNIIHPSQMQNNHMNASTLNVYGDRVQNDEKGGDNHHSANGSSLVASINHINNNSINVPGNAAFCAAGNEMHSAADNFNSCQPRFSFKNNDLQIFQNNHKLKNMAKIIFNIQQKSKDAQKTIPKYQSNTKNQKFYRRKKQYSIISLEEQEEEQQIIFQEKNNIRLLLNKRMPTYIRQQNKFQIIQVEEQIQNDLSKNQMGQKQKIQEIGQQYQQRQSESQIQSLFNRHRQLLSKLKSNTRNNTPDDSSEIEKQDDVFNSSKNSKSSNKGKSNVMEKGKDDSCESSSFDLLLI